MSRLRRWAVGGWTTACKEAARAAGVPRRRSPSLLRKNDASNWGAASVVARVNGRVGGRVGEGGALDGEWVEGRMMKPSRSAIDGGMWVMAPLLRLDPLLRYLRENANARLREEDVPEINGTIQLVDGIGYPLVPQLRFQLLPRLGRRDRRLRWVTLVVCKRKLVGFFEVRWDEISLRCWRCVCRCRPGRVGVRTGGRCVRRAVVGCDASRFLLVRRGNPCWLCRA